MTNRRILVGVIIIVLVLAVTAPAMAGGSWLEPDQERYEPGDTVTMEGQFSRGQLGWIEDGPFYAYLRWNDPDYQQVEGTPFGPIDTSIPLGELEIEAHPDDLNGTASITFELPMDLKPGEYWVDYCNDPCTNGIGDLIGGVIYVGIDWQDIHPQVADEIEHEAAAQTESTMPAFERVSFAALDAATAPRTSSAAAADVEPEAEAFNWAFVVLGAGFIVVAIAGSARLWGRRVPGSSE